MTLTDRWAALSGRERLLLTLAGLLGLLALLVMGVWQPMQISREQDLVRIARLDRMLAALSHLPAGAPIPRDDRPIATILTQTATAQGLEILRLDTPTPDTATLTLQEVAFDAVVLWIDALGRDSGLTVSAATIRQTNVQGLVSAELSLQRSAP